jgi:outer membrane protein assembly factor BamE (lipoprotein component of BamABCDE complex)
VDILAVSGFKGTTIMQRKITAPPIFYILLVSGLCGCVNAARNTEELHSTHERDMTVGIVQREIHRGMSAGEVAEELGSPNIVEKDEGGKETWIYDKIATEASYSRSSGDTSGLVGAGGLPGSALILGIFTGNYAKSAGASATTQKTLTVVIKFDNNSRVDSFSYHSSKF